MKGLIASAPMIVYYKPGEPSEVQCDNSQAGLDATLMQDRRPLLMQAEQ